MEKLERFINNVERDWIWRFREITAHSQTLSTISDELQQTVSIRLGIRLLYLHWEGFIKTTFRNYMETFKNINIRELSTQLKGLFLIGFIHKIQATQSINHEKSCKIVNFLLSTNNCSDIDTKECFNFKSNIDYDIFNKIINTTECPIDFSTKKNFIDKNFVNKRHAIAHGEKRNIDLNDYISIKEEVLELIQNYKEILIDSARKNMSS